MEHIGKHYEKEEREKTGLGEEKEDVELREWALEQGIVVDCGDKGLWLDSMQGTHMVVNRRGNIAVVDDVEEDAVGEEE